MSTSGQEENTTITAKRRKVNEPKTDKTSSSQPEEASVQENSRENDQPEEVCTTSADIAKVAEICKRHTEEIKTEIKTKGKEKATSAKVELENLLSTNSPGLSMLIEEIATIFELFECYRKENFDFKIAVKEQETRKVGEPDNDNTSSGKSDEASVQENSRDNDQPEEVCTTSADTAKVAEKRKRNTEETEGKGKATSITTGSKKEENTEHGNRVSTVFHKDLDQTELSENPKKATADLMMKLNAKKTSENEQYEQYKNSIAIKTKASWGKSADLRNLKHLSQNIQNIWENEWKEAKLILCKGRFLLDEFDAIVCLSNILKTCYKFCDEKAEEHLMSSITSLSPTDDNSFDKVEFTQEERHHLYKIREKLCMTAETKAHLCKVFWTNCLNKESKGKFCETAQKYVEQRERRKNKEQDGDSVVLQRSRDEESISSEDEELFGLQSFMKACVEACWDAVISDPKILLKFDIQSLNRKAIKAQYNFKSYTLKGSAAKPRKQIVIWPAVYIDIDGKEDVIASANALALF